LFVLGKPLLIYNDIDKDETSENKKDRPSAIWENLSDLLGDTLLNEDGQQQQRVELEIIRG